MKLCPEDSASFHRSNKLDPIVRKGDRILDGRRLKGEAVNEIKICSGKNSSQQDAARLGFHGVPADMRNTKLTAKCVKTFDSAWNQIQAWRSAAFAARGRQKLHPEADSENRYLGFEHCRANRIDPPSLREMCHPVRKASDTGQDDSIRTAQLLRAPHNGRCSAQLSKSPRDRTQITHPIVDNDDPHGLS